MTLRYFLRILPRVSRCLSSPPYNFTRKFSTTSFRCSSKPSSSDFDELSQFYDDIDDESDDIEEEDEKRVYAKMSIEAGIFEPSLSATKENILVIYPMIKGKNCLAATSLTTDELQLEEAIALVQTLPKFHVVDSIIVGTHKSTKQKSIWNMGKLEALLELKSRLNVTSIFINVDMLTPDQQTTLYDVFRVPIYDRYNIVLAIFKHYARTKEAELQIKLAEIPYIRQRLKYAHVNKHFTNTNILHLDDKIQELSFSKSKEEHFDILKRRENALHKRIKRAIQSKKQELEKFRPSDDINKTCLISIVGYTNAGKTTLIRRLSQNEDIQGENRLFATLDTSLHSLQLPSRNRTVLADTIGFIANLPIQLFASFSATLSHAVSADIIIHVIDVSHPDVVQQRIEVIKTLKELGIRNTTHRIIEVGNKIDKLSDPTISQQIFDTLETDPRWSTPIGPMDKPQELIYISCKNGDGLGHLVKTLDLHVMDITKSRMRRFKLKCSSPAIEYLYANKLVGKKPRPSEDQNHLIFDVFMNDDQFAKFQARLGKGLKKKE